jgi:hypothetical protein
MISPEIVTQFFPIAVRWVSEMEKAILESGQRLSPQSRKDAEAIGVQRTDDVRIIGLDAIPLPSDTGLRQLAVQTGLLTDRTIGMTFGHGIVIKNGSHGRGLIAHELAHVMQYERFGGIDTFLKEYIKEVSFPPRYPHGPLEREAAQIADRICRSP